MTRTESFFADKLNSCVAKTYKCIAVLTLLWVAAIAAGAITAQLDVPSDGEFLGTDHEHSMNKHILKTRFSDSAHFDVAIYFGVEDYNTQFYDTDGISKWETQKVGGPIFDPRFEMSSKVSQFYLLYFCADLRI